MSDTISTNRAGEQAVIDEIQRRGDASVTVMPGRRRYVVVRKDGAQYTIRIKARRSGTWQSNTNEAEPRSPEDKPHRFWVFVDLAQRPTSFFVAPEWWVKDDIHRAHQDYLARHGGHRARTEESTHHAIPLERIIEWRDRWDQLAMGEGAGDRRPTAGQAGA
jgi:hypothetical protein